MEKKYSIVCVCVLYVLHMEMLISPPLHTSLASNLALAQ